MKENKMYFLGFLFATGLLACGCEDDDGSVAEVTDTPTAQVVTEAEFQESQEATATINTVSQDTYIGDTGTSKQTVTAKTDRYCAEVTTEESEYSITVTIDYGTSCELNDEEVVSGILIVTYQTTQNEGEDVVITTTLENFMYNDISVAGSAITTYSSNEEDNFTFVTESDYSFEWPDGLTANSEDDYGTETVFEVNEDGNDSQFYWLVSGEGNTTFNNGDVYRYEITSPLRYEFNCRYIVSGVISISETSGMVTTDYGDGTCDSIATETDEDGNETIIDLDDDSDADEGETS